MKGTAFGSMSVTGPPSTQPCIFFLVAMATAHALQVSGLNYVDTGEKREKFDCQEDPEDCVITHYEDSWDRGM
jgi:hypothetical protein